MKCPYNGFQECIIQECPSCNYEVVENLYIEGLKPHWMSTETALKEGCQWEVKRKEYKFVSCKLIDGQVQPVPKNDIIINNKTQNRTNVSIRKSVF